MVWGVECPVDDDDALEVDARPDLGLLVFLVDGVATGGRVLPAVGLAGDVEVVVAELGEELEELSECRVEVLFGATKKGVFAEGGLVI